MPGICQSSTASRGPSGRDRMLQAFSPSSASSSSYSFSKSLVSRRRATGSSSAINSFMIHLAEFSELATEAEELLLHRPYDRGRGGEVLLRRQYFEPEDGAED